MAVLFKIINNSAANDAVNVTQDLGRFEIPICYRV